MSQDRVSVFLGVALLNRRNTDIRNEIKAMLKGGWRDCRVNDPNKKKCQNSGCLSLSWTKLPLLLLGHPGLCFITQIAVLSFLFPLILERTLTIQDTICQLIHLPLPEWKSCLRVLQKVCLYIPAEYDSRTLLTYIHSVNHCKPQILPLMLSLASIPPSFFRLVNLI